MKKMAKRLWSWLLAAAMLCSFVPMSRLPVSAGSGNTTEFAGGDGTEQNPYLIADKYQLNNVRNHLDAHFQMVADIEFTEADFAEGGDFYNDGQGWKPIGEKSWNTSTAFNGVFDGNGHIVNRLSCKRDYPVDIQCSGLFGSNAGCIKNLGMTNGNMYIETTKGTVYGGGIVGYNSGTINYCYNTGNITGWAMQAPVNTGGIAGYNSGTISNCYNVGNVSSRLIISDCYGDKNVYAGGIAGYSTYRDSVDNINTISNCYNIGDVLGSSIAYDYLHTGGIVGYTSVNETVVNCYYLKGKFRGNLTGTACAESQMTQKETFIGFDFETIWTMEGNTDYLYPELKEVSMQFEKTLKSISVTPPTKTEYLEGKDTLDVTGGKVILHYAGGTTETVDMTADMVSGFDNTKVGMQSLTVTCCGKTSSFGVEIIAKSLASIAVTTPPFKTDYLEGCDELNLVGGMLALTYNNGTTGTLDLIWADKVEGFDNTKIGTQTLTVTYQGKTTIFEIEIVEKSLESITVTTLPGFKSVYYEGEPFEASGIEVTAHYNNGTAEEVTDYEISGYDPTPGTKNILVTYQGKTNTFQVVVSEIYPIYIEVSKVPDKLWYVEGEAFDPTGMVVTALFNNGDTKEVTDYEISGYASTPGDKEITVIYRGRIATSFWIIVAEKSLTAIQVTTLPTKLEYYEYDTFDPSGMVVTAYFNNGTSEEVLDYTFGGYESIKPSMKTVKICYKGQTVSFPITVIPRPLRDISITPPIQLKYLENKDKLDVTGGKLILTYNNGSTEVIDLTAEMVGGFDNSEVGPQTLTVTYQGKTTTFEVEIIAKSLISITITKQPNKRTYIEGTTFDSTGMELTLIHDNGTTETIPTGWQEEYDFSRPGEATVTITYGGRETVLPVTVVAKSVTEIAITAMPDKTRYLEGEAFDPAGLIITAYYDNGAAERVTDYTIGGYDPTPGAKTITVSFGDCTAAFTVTVQAADVGRPTGDISGDGTVDTTDARLTLQYAVQKITLDESQLAAADVNGDGKVDTTDARLILQYAVEKLDRFPVDN